MRVLGLVHQYVPVRNAGAESHIHTMLRALVARGHRVDVVLSAQAGDPYVHDGVHVWPTKDQRKDVFDWLPDADVLVSHLDNTTRATVLGHLNNKPVALVHHNTFQQSKDALVLPSARADLVAVNSEHMAEDLRRWILTHDTQQPKIVITRPTADPAEFTTWPGLKVTLINLRRREGKDRDALSKGGELFRALAERMPEVEFLGVTGVYGTQQDMTGLSNVEVLPHVPHDQMRDRVYARTRILLVPSSYESWGRVASEAMCSGIPVIASPTPGLVEQLGEAGTLLDPGRVDAWEDAVSKLLNEPGHWKAQSAASLMRAHDLHDLGQQDLRRWTEAVESVVLNHHYDSGAHAYL